MEAKQPISSSVSSIFVHVEDMERAVNWYSRLLGVNISYQLSDHVVPIRLSNILLLLDSHRAKTFQPTEQPLFSFSTYDIDETLLFLDEIEVEVIGDIERFPDISFATIKDSEGNVLMVVQEHE